ncbi:UNVERIFIED_CONTAM: hypothetical protein Slati_1953700 [Sesamum latifolium]|uniref:B box-type domain-containing protein n=1 Tax=Sesamum latifolium TaxID=2727402 RepID=A0AAW2WLN5_9LAMI
MMMMMREEEELRAPAWLQGLMAETFFGACGIHENRRKNEKNIFCLNCCHSLCPHCLPSHQYPSHSHPLLQVVYQGQDLSAILYRFDESDLTISQFEGLRVDGSGSISDDGQIGSILEDPLEYGGSNYGTGNSEHATIRNSKNKGGFIMLSNWSNRRKGAPHRSPLS